MLYPHFIDVIKKVCLQFISKMYYKWMCGKLTCIALVITITYASTDDCASDVIIPVYLNKTILESASYAM